MNAPAVARARHATHVAFFIFGFVVSMIGVHVPSIRTQYRLDDGTLALALLGMALGALLCLAVAGRLIAAFGVRRVAAIAALAMCLALALVLQTLQFALLLATMVVLGAAIGLFDVAVNTEGSFIEAAQQRKVMSVMHGMWSLGGMCGALLGAWMIERGWVPLTQMRLVSAIGLAVALASTLGMLSAHAHAAGTDDASKAGVGWRQMPSRARRALLALGLLAVLGLLAEGALYDWSVLFLQRERGAEPALAALGFASFSGAMAAGRFGGDGLRARMPAARLLAASAALSSLAMALVLAWPSVPVALVGLAVVGLGLANVIPILFVTASRVDGASPAAGIALVSSFGWVGVVIGPPLVGGVAQISSLSWALTLVVLASAALAASARAVAHSSPTPQS